MYTPPILQMDSIRTPGGLHQESMDFVRSISGLHQEFTWSIRTPDGVHQDAWGSVTYRDGALRLALPPLFSKKSASLLVLQLIASAQRILWFEQQCTQK